MNGNDFFRPYDISDNLEDYKMKYLFEGVIPQSGFSLLIAKKGFGKSLFSMRMAACLATGLPIGYVQNPKEHWPFDFGYPKYPGATLYYSGEGQDGILGRMIAAHNALPVGALQTLPPAFNGQLPIICLGRTKRRLSMNKEIAIIQEAIKKRADFYAAHGYPLRLCIIDTLVSVFEFAEENSNTEMQEMVDALTEYGAALGCHVLVLGHPSKSHQRDKGDNRGASALKNSADAVLEINKVNNSAHRILSVTNIRDGVGEGAAFPFMLKESDDAPALVPAEKQTAQAHKAKQPDKIASLSEPQECILGIIAQAPDGEASRKYIYRQLLQIEAVEQAPKEARAAMRSKLGKRVVRALKDLLKKKRIAISDDNNKPVYSLATTNDASVSTNADTPTVASVYSEITDQETFNRHVAIAMEAFRKIADKLPPPLRNKSTAI